MSDYGEWHEQMIKAGEAILFLPEITAAEIAVDQAWERFVP